MLCGSVNKYNNASEQIDSSSDVMQKNLFETLELKGLAIIVRELKV